MVTSKKAPAKKTARKTAPRAPRKTATAAAPAAKAKAAASPGDLGKLLGRFKLPGIDVAAIVESQRKDMQALADANRQAYEGIKALAERRNEMLKEAFIQWRDADTEHLTWCTHGHDLHMLWSAGERPPWLRIHWVAPHGVVVRSEWMPDMAAAAALAPEPFRADLRRDGLDPVVPIARTRMHLVLDRGDAEPYTQPLTSGKEAGEERDTDCVLPGFTVWPRRADWSLQQAVVRFAPPSHPSMLRAVLERPAQ